MYNIIIITSYIFTFCSLVVFMCVGFSHPVILKSHHFHSLVLVVLCSAILVHNVCNEQTYDTLSGHNDVNSSDRPTRAELRVQPAWRYSSQGVSATVAGDAHV